MEKGQTFAVKKRQYLPVKTNKYSENEGESQGESKNVFEKATTA